MELKRLTYPNRVEEFARQLNAVHIGHELVMTDNLHGLSAYPEVAMSIFDYPAKIIGAMILLCVGGSISFKINLSSHTISEGEIIVILPGSIIQVETANSDLKFAVIAFASDYHEDIIDVTPQMRDSPVIRLSSPDFQECQEIYRNLRKHIKNGNINFSKTIAQGYLKVMCSLIFEYWRKDIKNDNKELSQQTRLYRKYIAKVQSDYHDYRSLKHYADSMCVSPKYLSKVVKLVSGRNASEFIDELVLFESKSLLMDLRYSIQQVADMMSFPNPSFFAKFFKKKCGMTPSAYRKTVSKGFKN